MSTGEIALLAWNDYVGITRCRGLPADAIHSRMATGLGWAVAGQAMTPFGDIAPNPWGPTTEVRQIPVPDSMVRVDMWPDAPPLHMYLCDSKNTDGTDWDCCTRAFMRHAMDDFRAETGLEFMAAFEHEFLLSGGDLLDAGPFTLEAARNAAGFSADLARALHEAGLEPETVEPEYGVRQYEVTVAPAIGPTGGDRAVLTREIIREVARRRGMRACFSPKPTPTGVGNGSHVHFSFVDSQGRNATYDPSEATEASKVAQHFIGGVLRHIDALTALSAPSPVSYLRLGPQHWSCGYASFGVQNRETAIRVCPSAETDAAKRARSFNLEFRPPDPTASPYIVLGALIRAGLSGIKDELPLPPICTKDPAELTDVERAELGITALPASFADALHALESDKVAMSWFPPNMLESYFSVKRSELEQTQNRTPEEVCEMYAQAY